MQVKRIRVALLCATGVAAAGAISAPAAAQKIEGQYVCVFQPALVAKGAVKSEAARSAAQGGGAVTATYENTIRGFAMNASAQGMANMMARNPRIAFCEQDQVMSIPTVQAAPGGVTAQAETIPWGITRVNGGVSGVTRRAWVLDTGIDLDHPDLNVNTALSKSFTREKNADDGNGHGSHVAGTIAAKGGNGIGVIGVAAGAQVIAVKVLTRNGSGTTSGVIQGVDYAAANFTSGDVANMSLGGGYSQALNDAVIAAATKGLRFALAAGNESTDASTTSPASANHANIYTISAFAQGDVWASYSNYGNPPVDYASYATLSGTSMAAPHMAGILLLGSPRSGGTVTGDPDGNPDTIGIY
jgi:hypothetical protein